MNTTTFPRLPVNRLSLVLHILKTIEDNKGFAVPSKELLERKSYLWYLFQLWILPLNETRWPPRPVGLPKTLLLPFSRPTLHVQNDVSSDGLVATREDDELHTPDSEKYLANIQLALAVNRARGISSWAQTTTLSSNTSCDFPPTPFSHLPGTLEERPVSLEVLQTILDAGGIGRAPPEAGFIGDASWTTNELVRHLSNIDLAGPIALEFASCEVSFGSNDNISNESTSGSPPFTSRRFF